MTDLKIAIVQSTKSCSQQFLREDGNDGEGEGEGIFTSK